MNEKAAHDSKHHRTIQYEGQIVFDSHVGDPDGNINRVGGSSYELEFRNHFTFTGVVLFASTSAIELQYIGVIISENAKNPRHIRRRPYRSTRCLSTPLNSIYRWMPSVDFVHLNPGMFAFTFWDYCLLRSSGCWLTPYGDGLNAPPSNEDIARVAVGSLRGTSVNAALAQGFSKFEVSQVRYYAEEARKGVYAIGAPTDHVLEVSGQQPEDFDTKVRALNLMMKMIATRVPDLNQWEQNRDHPLIANGILAQDNPDWLATAERQLPNLLAQNNI